LQANITENINKNQEELEKIKNTNNSPSIESMNNTETTANNTQENLEDNAEIIDKIDEKNNNEEEFF
jgi:endonuclease IV